MGRKFVGAGVALLFGVVSPVWAEDAPSDAREPEDFSVHLQHTFVYQVSPNFPSAYQTSHSFNSKYQARDTNTLTPFLGARLWHGAEIYLNPEGSQGFGLSMTQGLGGYTNGEAQKGGSAGGKGYLARLYLKQVFGLGGDSKWVEGAANQLAGWQDENRLTVIAGQVAANDFFQNNSYANDSRTSFLNWSMWGNTAWDAPSNSKGFTRGVYIDLTMDDWSLRYGGFTMPKILNGPEPVFVSDKSVSHNAEIEERFTLDDHPGKVRLLGFFNRQPMGNFSQALQLIAAGTDAGDALVKSRKMGREKFGFSVSAEQEVAEDFGLFGRLSWNNALNETWGFADAERSATLGMNLTGASWERPDDTIGVAIAANGLGDEHRRYLVAGGSTLFLGDGALNYQTEGILEAFYAYRMLSFMTVSGDYQLILNPGYNRDRGPANVIALRVHSEF